MGGWAWEQKESCDGRWIETVLRKTTEIRGIFVMR